MNIQEKALKPKTSIKELYDLFKTFDNIPSKKFLDKSIAFQAQAPNQSLF